MTKSKKLSHIMVDLETLGTRADSVILSIGAVKFDAYSNMIEDKGFYASVSIDSNHEAAPRHVSESTINWWMEQSGDAKALFSEPKTTLYSALQDFADWVDHGDYQVWGNGSDFDIAMLAHAFATNDLDIPWKFWNARCFRTIKNLPGMKNVVVPINTLKHNALHDALHQAQCLRAMFASMEETA